MKALFPRQEDGYFQTKMCDMERFILDGSAIIYVAMCQEVVVGYIWGYGRENENKMRLHVTQFVVGAEYRSLGIGNALLHYIEEWAWAHEVFEVELNVSAQNSGGIQFYQNNGFVCKNLFMVKESGGKSV